MSESKEFIPGKPRRGLVPALLRIAGLSILTGSLFLSACRTPVESITFPTPIPTQITEETNYDNFPTYWQFNNTGPEAYCGELGNYREENTSLLGDPSNGVYITPNLSNTLYEEETKKIKETIKSFNNIIPDSCNLDSDHPVLLTLVTQDELKGDVIAYVPVASTACGLPQVVVNPVTIRDMEEAGSAGIGVILAHEFAHTCPGNGSSNMVTITASDGAEYIISGRFVFRSNGEMFPILEEVFASLVALNSIIDDSNFKEYGSFRDVPEMEGLAYRGYIEGLEETLWNFGYDISPYELARLFVITADKEYPLQEIATQLDNYYSGDLTTRDFDIFRVLIEYTILNSQLHNESNSGQDLISNYHESLLRSSHIPLNMQ